MNNGGSECMNCGGIECTEEPRNSAFQGTYGFYVLLREIPYCQYIELKEKASRDLEFMLL